MSDIDSMNVGLRWYVAHTYSGYENKVKTNLEKIVENRGLGNLIYDIKVPVETIVEKDGDKEKDIDALMAELEALKAANAEKAKAEGVEEMHNAQCTTHNDDKE